MQLPRQPLPLILQKCKTLRSPIQELPTGTYSMLGNDSGVSFRTLK